MANRDAVRDALQSYLGGEGLGRVACLSGTWGSGKTHLWRELDQELKKQGKTTAYVSLFGLESVAEAKAAVVNSAVLGPHTQDASKAKQVFTRAGEWIVRQAPALIRAADTKIGFELLTKNLDLTRLISDGTIVCLDDLERVSDRLRLEDVLGFANLLAEQRHCRVLLIMNEDHLDQKLSTSAVAIVRAYRERVVGRFLKMETDLRSVLPFILAANRIDLPSATIDIVLRTLEKSGSGNIRTLIRSIENAFELQRALSAPPETVDVSLITALTSEHALGALSNEELYDFHPVVFAIPRDRDGDDPLRARREAFHGKYFFTDSDYLFQEVLFRFVRDGYLDAQRYRRERDERAGRSTRRSGCLLHRINERDFHYLSDAESVEWLRDSKAVLLEEKDLAAIAVSNIYSVAELVAERAGLQLDAELATAAENALIDAGRRLDRSFEQRKRSPRDTRLPDALQKRYDDELAAAVVGAFKDKLLQAILDTNEDAFFRAVRLDPPASAEAALDPAILSELHASMARNRRFWCSAVEAVGGVFEQTRSEQARERLREYLAVVRAFGSIEKTDERRVETLYRDVNWQ